MSHRAGSRYAGGAVKSDKCGLKCGLRILEQHWSNLLEIKGGPGDVNH